jgi:L-lactate utilization protein LutC
MSAREAILGQVRSHLGRIPDQPPEGLPEARIRVPEMSRAARVELLMKRVIALSGTAVQVADNAEARDLVLRLTGGAEAVASNSPVLAEAGITAIPGVQTGFTSEAALRAVCATAPFGISSADYALCDTGTLVMMASPAEARLISLLPPVHIAVVPAERILTGLDELFALDPRPADHTSSTVFITGPSRTADIEQLLVRGVHGPGEIHLIIVG